MMPHLVMLPFDFGRKHIHFGSTSESNMHKSEEHSEGGKMEVDSVVASKLHLIEPEVISSTRNFLSVVNVFDKAEGSTYSSLYPCKN